MPGKLNLPTLEQVYTARAIDDTYSYNQIGLIESLPHQNQIQVRWLISTVSDDVGQPVVVSTLSPFEQEQIYVIGSEFLTFNVVSKTVTIDSAVSSGNVTVITDEGTTVVYVRPSIDAINNVQTLNVRRAVDISTPVVNFQPGSRLTSDQLNESITQLLFSNQELTKFGAVATSGEVDLSSKTINELGDVSINLTNSGALLVVGQDGVISDSTSAGSNEVLSVNGETGVVTLYTDNIDEDISPTNLWFTDARATTVINNTSITALDDVDTTGAVENQTLRWDGTNWIPHSPITIESGTGIPPQSWIDNAVPGDIYIRV
jgi:hypothetical protein